MKPFELLKRYYKEVDAQILSQYEESAKSVWVNTDDKDLIPIEILLPQPPEPHKIDNWGLQAKEQMWHPPKLPKRLKELQSKYETLDEIWDELEEHKDIYADEIEFIRLQWQYRLNGYWFWNNGIPTYIDGWHYFYCAWWHIDTGLPQYRDRDRRFFLFARKVYTETRYPVCDVQTGYAIKDKRGDYTWIETLNRVLVGFNYPKHRREGASYKGGCVNYEIISRTINARGGIQSMNDDKAKVFFLRHVVSPWKKLPFFFKPNYEGSTSPKTELSFTPTAKRLSSGGSRAMSELGLESGIDFGTAEETSYEGTKLYVHNDDEVGRLKKGINCETRHTVVKECLMDGKNIIGFTLKTSTVGEMEKGGGKAFKNQCKMSDYYHRNLNGQTETGLVNLFIPAYDGLTGFIDKYGMSVINTPNKEQAAFIGSKIGAYEYIMNERKGVISDPVKLSDKIRLYPIRFAECFRTASKSSGFNMTKLETYIDNLSFQKQPIVRGNFEWYENERDTRVIFVPTSQGRFMVSHQLEDNEANRKFRSEYDNLWEPGNTQWGVAGGDPFKFNITKGNRLSNGGGAVVKKGKIKDGDFAMKRKFACTYNFRPPDKDAFAEDMLKMCIYYGVKMFPETNVPLLWDYFAKRGYEHYLLYKYDPKTFVLNRTPGEQTGEKIKQNIFQEFMMWIENEANEENHIEVLIECRDIEGPEDMTNYDLFTAAGYALLGTISSYDDIEELDEQKYTLDNFLRKKTYSAVRNY
jgi:hypothetical protein